MKIILTCLLTCAALNLTRAQDFETFKQHFTSATGITSVSDIETKNDFLQKSLTSDEVDRRIAVLMNNVTIGNYDIPINLSKLKYHNRKNPKDEIAFNLDYYAQVMTMINKEVEIYSYDGVWILVADQSPKNLMNVFFSARALQILKTKYPEAYTTLIKPDQVELGYKKLEPNETKPTLNRLVPVISFDKSPSKIAGSLWNQLFAQVATREYNGFKWFENTLNAVTSINYETDRPKEIYGQTDPVKNYWLYLKEGLVESIGHEFTHHYITNFKFFDKKAGHVFDRRYDTTDKKYSFDVEEALVINTTQTYFLKKGGLSKELTDFNMKVKYQDKKNILSNMTDALNVQRYEKLKSLSPASSITFDQIYRFDFYERLFNQ